MIDLIDIKFENPISPQMISSILIIAILSIVFILVGRKVGKLKPTDTPKGFVFFCVMVVEMFGNFISENLPGKRFQVFGPYLFSVIVFLGIGNSMSLLGLAPPFSNLGMAMSMSIMTFFILQFAEFKFQGVKGKMNNLLGAFKPLFFLLMPMNIIGEFSKPLTMGLRLFVNLFSGTIISIMVFSGLNFFVGIFQGIVGVTAGLFLHGIFDVFFGLIQAFVFFMLSLVNISMAAAYDSD